MTRIAMWSGPRNLSTAMLRSWEHRADTEVLDEPLYAAYLATTGLDHPGCDEIIAAGPADFGAAIATRALRLRFLSGFRERGQPQDHVSGVEGLVAYAPAGGDPIVDVPTVDLAAGSNLIVYAVGSLADDTFTFYTQEIEVGSEAAGGTDDADGSDGTPAPTAVNTGSPITDSVNMSLLAAAAGMLVLAGGALTLRTVKQR